MKEKITEQNVLAFAQIYEYTRNFFIKKNNLKYKKFVSSDIKKSKWFKDFYKAVYFIREVKKVDDINVKKFIYAQFAQNKKDIFPSMLYSKWALKNYYVFLKREKIKKKKQGGEQIKENNMFDMIEDSKKVLLSFMKTKEYKHNVWEIRIKYKGVKMSLMWYLFLNRKISPYFLIVKKDYLKEIDNLLQNGLITKQDVSELFVARQRLIF